MLTEPLRISHSDIAAFLRCRRSWAWGFLDDVKKPESLVGPAQLGTRVHVAFERYYRDGADPIIVHDTLAKEHITWLETHGAPIWEIDQLYEEMIIGRNCVTAYLDWLARTGADSEFEVYATESKREAPLLDGQVILIGKVDIQFISRVNGMLYNNDWKTSSAQGSVREGLERSFQSPTYLILAEAQPREHEIGGAMLTVIRKTKNLARARRELVERFPVPATRRVIAAKRKQIEAICAEMLKIATAYYELGGGDGQTLPMVYPSPEESCRWCDYRQPCELEDESHEAAQALIGSEFQHGGKHDRYGHD